MTRSTLPHRLAGAVIGTVAAAGIVAGAHAALGAAPTSTPTQAPAVTVTPAPTASPAPVIPLTTSEATPAPILPDAPVAPAFQPVSTSAPLARGTVYAPQGAGPGYRCWADGANDCGYILGPNQNKPEDIYATHTPAPAQPQTVQQAPAPTASPTAAPTPTASPAPPRCPEHYVYEPAGTSMYSTMGPQPISRAGCYNGWQDRVDPNY